MALYWTSAGLSRLAQSESSGRADLIHYPSGYTKSGVRSSASGLYGYLDSTWQTYASRAGVDTSVYPRAYMAPADVQTAVAAQTPISHWTCPGCNSVAESMSGNPQYVSATPGSGGPIQDDPSYSSGRGTGLEIDPSDPAATDPAGGAPQQGVIGTGVPGATGTTSSSSGLKAGTGTPVNIGLQSATVNSITTWLNNWLKTGITDPLKEAFGSAQNWFQRAVLMLIAMIILLVALWKLAGEPPIPGVGTIGKMVKA